MDLANPLVIGNPMVDGLSKRNRPKSTRPKCGAKTRAGTPCRRSAMANGRCQKHGGPTPAGIASPHFKTGKHSKYLPSGFREHYLDAINDPNLLTLREDLALLDARIASLLEKLGTGESRSRWQMVRESYETLKAATARRDVPAMIAALDGMGQSIEAAQGEDAIWTDLGQAIEQKRKVASTEAKRLAMKHHVLTEERAYQLLQMVLVTSKEFIPRAALSQFANRLEIVMGSRPAAALISAGAE